MLLTAPAHDFTIEQKHPVMMKNKLESVLTRLNRLENAPSEEKQHERWEKLVQ